MLRSLGRCSLSSLPLRLVVNQLLLADTPIVERTAGLQKPATAGGALLLFSLGVFGEVAAAGYRKLGKRGTSDSILRQVEKRLCEGELVGGGIAPREDDCAPVGSKLWIRGVAEKRRHPTARFGRREVTIGALSALFAGRSSLQGRRASVASRNCTVTLGHSGSPHCRPSTPSIARAAEDHTSCGAREVGRAVFQES